MQASARVNEIAHTQTQRHAIRFSFRKQIINQREIDSNYIIIAALLQNFHMVVVVDRFHFLFYFDRSFTLFPLVSVYVIDFSLFARKFQTQSHFFSSFSNFRTVMIVLLFIDFIYVFNGIPYFRTIFTFLVFPFCVSVFIFDFSMKVTKFKRQFASFLSSTWFLCKCFFFLSF